MKRRGLNTTWLDKMKAGQPHEAIAELRRPAAHEYYLADFLRLGALYMWIGDYWSALAHFQEQIQSDLPIRASGDSDYGTAGCAAWCLGDTKLAVKFWKKGRTAGYAQAGNNTRTSLLLYAGAVLEPEAFPLESAGKLLEEKAAHWRVKNWPGPIAQFLLGQIADEATAELMPWQWWQFDFYKLLWKAASGTLEPEVFGEGLRALVQVAQAEILKGDHLVPFLGSEEFDLCRHQVSGSLPVKQEYSVLHPEI